jgi:hypothetical protein
MTKKAFIELASYHQYGKRNERGFIALFFDWMRGDDGVGYKYCVYARALNSTKKELIDALYNAITKDEDTPWYVQTIIAQENKQRFKVPIVASGLFNLIKHN